MGPLLTSQGDGMEPVTYDARTNDRNDCFTRAPQKSCSLIKKWFGIINEDIITTKAQHTKKHIIVPHINEDASLKIAAADNKILQTR